MQTKEQANSSHFQSNFCWIIIRYNTVKNCFPQKTLSIKIRIGIERSFRKEFSSHRKLDSRLPSFYIKISHCIVDRHLIDKMLSLEHISSDASYTSPTSLTHTLHGVLPELEVIFSHHGARMPALSLSTTMNHPYFSTSSD